MNLSTLKPAKGSVQKNNKTLGRGQGSGKGGTATRGHKGAKSRSGYSKKIGFEGGQMPLQRRIPKFGFKNINRKNYVALNLGKIQELLEKGVFTDELTVEKLREIRFIKKKELVKVLADGELKSKVKIQAHKFTSSAKNAIEKQGGQIVNI